MSRTTSKAFSRQVIVLVVTTLAIACSATRPSARDAAAEVLRLQVAMSAASERGDRATLERRLAPGFVLMFVRPHMPPKLLTRAQVIERWTKSDGGGGTSKVSDQSVVVTGDGAVAFATILDEWMEEGVRRRAVTRVSDTWQLVDGNWLWIASHETLAEESPGAPLSDAGTPAAPAVDAGVPDAAPAVAAVGPFGDEAIVSWRRDGRAFVIAHGKRAVLVHPSAGAPTSLPSAASLHRALAFSPDGALLASLGEDGVLHLHDGSTGGPLAELRAPDAARDATTVAVPTIAFSADGKRLVAVTDRARVWNVAARSHVCTVMTDWVYNARLSPDASMLVGSSLTGWFGRFDAGSCALRAEASADTGGTFATALSPDARWLASSEQGHGLKIHVVEPKGERDVKTPDTTCTHHVSPTFSADGKTLVVLADWYRSYNVPGFTVRAAWTPPKSERDAIQATLDDGVHVIEQDASGTRIIDVRKPFASVRFDALGATRFFGSPDSAWLVGISPRAAHVWATATGARASTVDSSALD